MIETKKMDIVYLVKDTQENEELRYSLRTVQDNFPHDRVFFVGGKPNGLEPDGLIMVSQDGFTKWDNTHKMIQAVCLCDELSDDVVLFNDDFFVMKPVPGVEYYYEGMLSEKYAKLKQQFPNSPKYRSRLGNAIQMLHDKMYGTFNYEVHLPFVFNRKEMLQLYKEFPYGSAMRSMYANRFNKGGVNTSDVKIYNDSQIITGEETFLSTTDRSFKELKVGDRIRKAFPHKSIFEE